MKLYVSRGKPGTEALNRKKYEPEQGVTEFESNKL